MCSLLATLLIPSSNSYITCVKMRQHRNGRIAKSSASRFSAWPLDAETNALVRRSLANPRAALVFAVVITAAAAVGLMRLELRTDGRMLVPHDDPAVVLDARIRQEFGLRDSLVVYIETAHPAGLYNSDTLQRIRELSRAIGELEGVGAEHVMSLATENTTRLISDRLGLSFQPFLEPLPADPKGMAELRQDIDATSALLTGTLVSEDRRGLTILVDFPPSDSTADRTALYHRVLALVKPFETDGHRIFVVGAPVAQALLGEHLLADLALLLPVSVMLIAVVIWIGCRSVWGVGLALAEVGACLLFTFGAMGWAGVPVYLTTAVLPVILVTIGLADEIHIFWHYQRLTAVDPVKGEPEAVERTMREMVRPITLTSLTTGVGFLTFLTSPLPAVRSFGLFAALGIGFCLLFSLVAIPAALVLLGPGRMRRGAARPLRLGSWLERRIDRVVSRRRVALVGLSLLTAAIGIGALRLQVQDSWIDGFAEGSAFRLATEHVEEKLYGTHTLLIRLTIEDRDRVWPRVRAREGPLLDPDMLRAIGRFEAFLREQPSVGGVLGPYTHMATMSHLTVTRHRPASEIPDDPRLIQVALERFDQSRSVRRRRQVIHDDLRRSVVTLLLKGANYRDSARLMAAVRVYETEQLAPLGIRADFAGDIAVSQAMIPAIVRTQLWSLALALGGGLFVVGLLTRSLWTGLLALLPTSLALAWVFGIMGWLRIPIGVATSTFSAITIGIGVDYAIHFLERVRRTADSETPVRMRVVVHQTLPAILTDAAAVGIGFGVLGLSRVPANARLGLLVAVALVSSALLTLVGLAALLADPQPEDVATPPVDVA